jgi:hypothetical protein
MEDDKTLRGTVLEVLKAVDFELAAEIRHSLGNVDVPESGPTAVRRMVFWK